jgi:hypothetical protein
MPTGCVWAEVLGSLSTNVYFNTHGTGGPHSERHALCAEAPPLRPDVAPYTLAAYGASACATNSVPIPSSVAEPCAAANERLVPGGLAILVHEASTSGKPLGCSHQYRGYSTPYVYRNTYSSGVGSGRDDFQPICTAGVAYSALQANRCDVDLTLDRLMVRIGNEALCKATRASLGLAGVVSIKLQNGSPENSAKGCYYHDDPAKPTELGVWFNVHATGGTSTVGIFSMCVSSDFELGVPGSNACPAPARAIATADACHAAAVAMGITTFSVPPPDSTKLDGCHIRASDKTAYFNSNAVGTGSGDALFQPLCTHTYAFGTTGVNACLAGDVAITTLAACQLAANALGLFGTGDAAPNFGSVQTESSTQCVPAPRASALLFLFLFIGHPARGRVLRRLPLTGLSSLFSDRYHAGCYLSFMASTIDVLFNTHATGGANTYHTTVCIAAGATVAPVAPSSAAPTAAPSHSPTMAPTIAPLDAVAPYVLGAFNSNECAADGALIPVTSGNVAFLCEVAVSKLTANSAYPGDLNLPQGSDSTKPRGCSTGGGQAPRTYYSNSGGGTAGALATNGLQTICSVGYAYNVENTNACPLASAVPTVPIRIARSAHCEAARVALGIGGYLKDTNIGSNHPKGCYYNDVSVRRTHARLLSPLDSSSLL